MRLNSPTPLLIGFEGIDLNSKLQQHLLKINPAGIVLFKRNIVSLVQTKNLILSIRELLGKILVAIDHEGGGVNRFPAGCPSPPSPMGLNRSSDPSLMFDACRMQAEVLAYLGINLNFAPVLDLAAGLRNPAIGTRAFSDKPEEISQYGKICVDAHRNLRVGTTAKHFPGHGRSETDSHHAAGEVRADKATLWAEDLLPFRELVAYGIPAVMLAHLTYPALDPENPAVFSRKIVTELLRGQMGFEGLVISDCVEMSAISQSDNPSRIIQRGLFAGIDLFISSFSLMKSLAFQLELKKALDEVQLAQAEDNGVNKATEYRLYGFLNEYPGQPAGEDALQVDVEKTAALHRRTIHMQRKAPLREAYRQFFLLELSNREQKGINADEHWGPVAKQLLDSQALIKQHQILFECDIPAVGKIINQANRDHLTVILLTNAGFAREGYIPFLKYLKNADSAIHVSLSDERDLTGTLDNEWVVWGFNSWTAMALSEELLVA